MLPISRNALVLLTIALLFPHAAAAVEAGRRLVIEGSSTVFPITTAMAERYRSTEKSFRVEVAGNGTSAGFRQLLAGRADMADASRAIKPAELDAAGAKGIAVVELPIGYDGITLVVSRQNKFVDHLTVAELRAIWSTNGLTRWSQVRPGWPDAPIALFGPGKDSGTFDFFGEAVTGGKDNHRTDFSASEDDNELVQGVVANEYALGYFGYAYFLENASLLRAIPIDSGAGPVEPAAATIHDGSYKPLARPLFVYANAAVLAAQANLRGFLGFYLDHPEIITEVGYVPLDAPVAALVRDRLTKATTGSLFAAAPAHATVEQVLRGTATAAALVAPAVVAAAAKTGAATPLNKPVATTAAPAKPVVKPVVVVAAASATTTAAFRLADAEGTQAALNGMRSHSLDLARQSLDDQATLAGIERSAQATAAMATILRSAFRDHPDSERLTVSQALALCAADPVAYATVVERLALTAAGRELVTATSFAGFKSDLAAVTDPALRGRVMQSLVAMGPQQVSAFSVALAGLGEHPGWKADNLVACYAAAGMALP